MAELRDGSQTQSDVPLGTKQHYSHIAQLGSQTSVAHFEILMWDLECCRRRRSLEVTLSGVSGAGEDEQLDAVEEASHTRGG
jgi:hypothetical protein